MFGKKAALVGLITTGLVAGTVAVASADAGSGVTSVLIGRGQSDHSIGIQQRKGNDVVTVQNTFATGGFTGWHSHPGIVVIAVQSGKVTLFSEPVGGGECSVHTYTAGQVFVEHPEDGQTAVNTGDVQTVVAATYFNVPHGGSNRIERTDPGNCPS